MNTPLCKGTSCVSGKTCHYSKSTRRNKRGLEAHQGAKSPPRCEAIVRTTACRVLTSSCSVGPAFVSGSPRVNRITVPSSGGETWKGEVRITIQQSRPLKSIPYLFSSSLLRFDLCQAHHKPFDKLGWSCFQVAWANLPARE